MKKSAMSASMDGIFALSTEDHIIPMSATWADGSHILEIRARLPLTVSMLAVVDPAACVAFFPPIEVFIILSNDYGAGESDCHWYSS